LGALHIYPNPELAPETSVNMEGGIKQGFKFGGVTGYVDVVAFRQDFNRYVEFTFGQWGADRSIANFLGFGFKSINTGGARITGGELEVAGKGKLGNVELTLLMGYTHTLPVSTTPNEAYAFSHTTANTDEPVSYANTAAPIRRTMC
jgi:outer membrane receptor protein involved in Fe transport